MSSRSSLPVSRPAKIGYCLILLCAAVAVLCAATAHASYYKMLFCANGNDAWGLTTATNTASGANPGGIFIFQDQCTASSSDPAGDNAFLRIVENQSGGNAGVNAYGSMSWTAPPWVSIIAGGGYTREPNAFNEGWRGRFWAEGYDGSTNNILMQGYGVANGSEGGIGWGTTSTFASHLWPFGGYGNYRRFVFELTCFRPAGCDRTNFNAVDANTLTLILNDTDPAHINLTGGAIASGEWVRGAQNVTWNTSDNGSGLRFERLRVDGGQRYQLDYGGSCNLGWTGSSGEFARDFQPCPTGGPYGRAYTLDTSSLSDGAHTVQVCAQDYGQAAGLNGSGGESCDQREIHVDNTPPSAPGGLTIATANPARYLDHFGASWTLPPDPGSPITKVHYSIVTPAGTAVMPEKVISAVNPTKLENIEGPKAPGDYRLRVWLEDAVGFTGPMSTVPIPHDSTPPTSPQDVSVTAPTTSRSEQGFDVRWRNITDTGSPINTLHYQVLNGAGGVVVPTKDIEADNPQAIQNLETPRERGEYTLKLWLSDAEGNVGAPVKAPLTYDCVRSDVGGGQTLTAGLGEHADPAVIVPQDQGSTLTGSLTGPGGQIANAPVCIFSNVVTDQERDFLGVAMTGQHGDYKFAIGAGPSREVTAIYRPDQREIAAHATIQTRVHPTFEARKATVHNHSFAVFSGEIPGPNNDKVLVVLQVKSGKGWRVFRRYRTRDNGHFLMRYLFTQTNTPTTYVMRAQVRETIGYPYLQGNSRSLPLRVLPSTSRARGARSARSDSQARPARP